jgi:penicillin-binding protein 1A
MNKLIKRILKYIAILLPWLAVLGFIIFAYYYHDLPNSDKIQIIKNEKTIEILYSNGNKITTIGDNYNDQINYNQLPQNLINAVIATEDRRFFNHGGFDIIGTFRAFYRNIKAGYIVQGGSTITQQLAKLLYFDSRKTMKRKIQELLLAIKLERIFSKEQILTLYLNRAYFGEGNYGVSSASKHYFKKNVWGLNLNQSAMLAGLLKAPSKLSPNNNQELAEIRTNQVLKNMTNAGYLNKNEIINISNNINYKTDKMQKLYFANYTTNNFDDFLSNQQKDSNFFSIETTLDYNAQNKAEDVIDRYVKEYGDKIGKSQIAAIIMNKNGAIKAMIGGKNYQESQFNRATNAKRQIGSIFKTFIYLQAFNEKYDENDKREDKIINIGDWHPENYNNKYYGEVTLKEAFAKSLNSVAIQLFQDIDKEKLVRISRKMGIFSDIDKYDPTISLGTTQASLIELVTAFNVIANDGQGIMPHHINKIKDQDGNILYERYSSGLGQIIEYDSIYKLKNILREVVENGTGRRANISNNIHGKTGTTQNYQDAWFIGFDDDNIIGIWIGNDDNSATNNITGGSLPAQIFADIIREL